MIRVAVVGLGKMGISHLAIIGAHPDVEVAAVCDATGYVLDVLHKYSGVTALPDYRRLLDEVEIDAVILATPTAAHADMAQAFLERGVNVFCEKPLTLDAAQSRRLAALAADKGLVNQVGYHNRFVGAFREVKRLLDLGAIGQVTHVLAEAYGGVVLRPKGSTWRSQSKAGGGCLYDYAAHPINLLNWYFGAPASVSGTVLNSIFSSDTNDEVYSTVHYASGGPSAQLSVNWSDGSQRKMSTKLTIWGTAGRIVADRQEVQVYLREKSQSLPEYEAGWTVRNATELNPDVWFYLRGEEYSAQLDYFVQAVQQRGNDNLNSFESAAETDSVIDMLLADGAAGPRETAPVARSAKAGRSIFVFGR